jgi:hypothetical protein
MTKRNADVVLAESGEEIGKVTDIIPNPRNLEPEWIVVKSGRFGPEHLVPIAAVEHREHEYVAPFDGELLKSTPTVGRHMAPTTDERDALYEHFGLKAS